MKKYLLAAVWAIAFAQPVFAGPRDLDTGPAPVKTESTAAEVANATNSVIDKVASTGVEMVSKMADGIVELAGKTNTAVSEFISTPAGMLLITVLAFKLFWAPFVKAGLGLLMLYISGKAASVCFKAAFVHEERTEFLIGRFFERKVLRNTWEVRELKYEREQAAVAIAAVATVLSLLIGIMILCN